MISVSLAGGRKGPLAWERLHPWAGSERKPDPLPLFMIKYLIRVSISLELRGHSDLTNIYFLKWLLLLPSPGLGLSLM